MTPAPLPLPRSRRGVRLGLGRGELRSHRGEPRGLLPWPPAGLGRVAGCGLAPPTRLHEEPGAACATLRAPLFPPSACRTGGAGRGRHHLQRTTPRGVPTRRQLLQTWAPLRPRSAAGRWPCPPALPALPTARALCMRLRMCVRPAGPERPPRCPPAPVRCRSGQHACAGFDRGRVLLRPRPGTLRLYRPGQLEQQPAGVSLGARGDSVRMAGRGAARRTARLPPRSPSFLRLGAMCVPRRRARAEWGSRGGASAWPARRSRRLNPCLPCRTRPGTRA